MWSPHSRKAWMYVLPVLFVSLAINVPKFMEVRLDFVENDEGKLVPAYDSTSLRFDETYIRVYIMWTRCVQH